MPPSELLRACLPPPLPSINSCMNVFKLKAKPNLLRYYHAAAGFPAKPTWLTAIKNNHYASWTGLTYSNVAKHFPGSEETWKGHGKKIPSGLRTTKTARVPVSDGLLTDNATKLKTNAIYTQTFNLSSESNQKIYTDQTGKFPAKSYQGNQYIMVLVKMDGNAILVEPFKNQTSGELVKTYQILVDRLKNRESNQNCIF